MPASRFGCWGEMLPFFLRRLDDALPEPITGLRRSIGDTYREQVFVTPSGMLDSANLAFCRDVLGADRILFSVDCPYLTMAGARAWLEALPVDGGEGLAIASGTVERSIPSLALTA